MRKNSLQGKQGETLGRREREVLQHLAGGKTSAQIAEEPDIATSTVEDHHRNIMRKLDPHSVAELIKYPIREGLTSISVFGQRDYPNLGSRLPDFPYNIN